jgi:hypothetical protein
MKFFAILVLAVLMFSTAPPTAEAQWGYRPVVVAPRPAMRVDRQPTVFYQPTTVVYSRRRPILGGYSVRTRPGVQRTVVW